MAFKMKGSAFKLGNVATKSALKQKSPVKDKLDPTVLPKTTTEGKPNHMYDYQVNQYKEHNRRHAAGEIDDNHKEIEKPKKEEEKSVKKDSGLKMKSPMKGEKKMVDGKEIHPDGHEGHHKVGKAANQKWGKGGKSPLEQKKIKEGLKKVGKFLKEGKVPNLNKLTENVKTAVSKKIKKHKPVTTETKTEGKYQPHRVKYEGTEDEITEGLIPVTTSKETKKRKLFGGKKETKSSITKTHEEHRYKDDEGKDKVDRYNPTRGGKRGPTTITHTRKKKRGGGKKKEITIDPSGKKTVTKYDKEGNVKKVKVKKGRYQHETGQLI